MSGEPVSNCCAAPMKQYQQSGYHYVCDSCQRPCDVLDRERAAVLSGLSDQLPDGLRIKVAIALHDAECPDRTCEPSVMGKFFRQADVVLEAAAPAIAAQAAAAERERIRQLARARAKSEYYNIPAATLNEFADLLDGAQ